MLNNTKNFSHTYTNFYFWYFYFIRTCGLEGEY